MPVQGRPIYIQHLGAIHYKKLEAVTTEERMIKFHVQEYERCARIIMPACSIVAGRHIDQTFAIIDVKGACTVQRGSLGLRLFLACLSGKDSIFVLACTSCIQSCRRCRQCQGPDRVSCTRIHIFIGFTVLWCIS